MITHTWRLRIFFLCVPCLCYGQNRLPVVFVNGFQFCPSDGITGTFGQLPSLLAITTYFFYNCTYGDLTIESLAVRFQQYLAGIPAPQVDVVAHSMGGLIVRAYLAGLQPGDLALTPPVNTKIRKVVFIGTPHFGTNAFSLFTSFGIQTSEMEIGSAMLFDLATWNQGTDDLRGVDAIAIIGNGGTSHYDDGLVPLSSSSLAFAAPDHKTRVIPLVTARL